LKPFSKIVWITLVALIVVGVLISFVMKSRTNSNFSYIKILSILFAVSLRQTPTKSSLRLLHISLLVGFLVLQTAYQGFLFKLLQTEGKMKPVETIDELIERNLKVYTIGSQDDLFEGNTKLKQRFERSKK
jgi:hypothetical protein